MPVDLTQNEGEAYQGSGFPRRGRAARQVDRPIRVHSIGFPRSTPDILIGAWLAQHGFPEPIRIDRGKGRGKYAWARLLNVSPLFRYRTKHWDTSLGRVAVRFAIHRLRKPKAADLEGALGQVA